MDAYVERRRSPRVEVRHEVLHAALPTATSVQIVDISQTGVLLAGAQRFEPGQRAQLRTRIGAEPLNVAVEVQRVAAAPPGGPHAWHVGAAFVGLDDESRRKIGRLLKTGE